MSCDRCKEDNIDYALKWRDGSTKYYCEDCFVKCNESIMERINSDQCQPLGDDTRRLVQSWKDGKNNNTIGITSENKREKVEALLAPFIGMEDVKETIRSWMDRLQGEARVRTQGKIKLDKSCFHMTITGSSGVGKTEIARIIAKVLKILGVVEKDNFVETNRDGLIGEHVGATGPKTKKVIAEAQGGVLFIDEAPGIWSKFNIGDKADYGKEAVNTLMDALEKDRGRTVFIFAGYQVEMENFLLSNQGLSSRVPISINITDYTPKEIAKIISLQLKNQGFKTELITEALEKAVKRKSQKGIVAGNGRTARVMAEEIAGNYLKRLTKGEGELSEELLPEDIHTLLLGKRSKQDEEGLEEIKKSALEKLNALSGLQNIKKQIQKIGAFEYVQRKKEELGLPTNRSALHMTFNGNPGTGKTTVARILGEYFRGIGILSRGHFIELSKADLVQGNEPTAATVKKIVKTAIGGVLFIDEAYTLAREKQGIEALDTLIKEMEDRRDDLVVILAGYSKEMEKLYEANPGLRSRVAYPLTFNDYEAQEVIQILNDLLGSQQLTLTEAAGAQLISFVEEFHANGWVEANGRWVRNVFEKIIMAQSLRVVESGSTAYTIVEENDIKEVMSEMPKETSIVEDIKSTTEKLKEMLQSMQTLTA